MHTHSQLCLGSMANVNSARPCHRNGNTRCAVLTVVIIDSCAGLSNVEVKFLVGYSLVPRPFPHAQKNTVVLFFLCARGRPRYEAKLARKSPHLPC